MYSGEARFVSVTYRLFKLPPGAKIEPLQVMYNGEITGYEQEFKFDHQHVFKVGFYNYLNKFKFTCLDFEMHVTENSFLNKTI